MAQGRIIRCANAPCQRVTRLIGPVGEGEVYTCTPCESGQPPFTPGGGRDFGQPKQRKGSK